jgi:TolB-like protein/Tfp pilus assembly protein PilF
MAKRMSLFAELKRRKVFRVAVVYAATAFVVLQAADIMLPRMGIPDWGVGLVVALAVLGFPIALVLAWALELTPDGLKRTESAPTTNNAAPPALLGKRTVFAAALLVVLGIGIGAGWFLRPLPVAPTPMIADEPAAQPAIEHSIAVLAFDNMSPDPDNAFFAEGISEEILNLLAAVERLSVASRTSAFSYRGKDVPIPDIAAQLGVRYVLEGSVRRAGNQVRITAQLIDAATDRHLWSANYDRALADVFAVQDEIAAAIGQALQIALLGPDGETVTATEIAPDLYEKFLQSRFLIRQRNLPAIARATALLEQVVQGEPDFAPALAQLAEAHVLSSVTVETAEQQQDHFDRILGLVGRALALDPSLAGAYAVRGNVAMDRGQYVDALGDYRHAIELDPDDPRSHHWLAMLYSDSGHLEQAERAIATSLRLDPDNANAQAWFADLLASRGDWEEAIEVYRRVVDLGNPVGHAYIAMYLLAIDHQQYFKSAESEFGLALAKGTPPELVPLQLLDITRGDEKALESLLDDARNNRLWPYIAISALLVADQHEALLTLLEWDFFLHSPLAVRVWSIEHAAMRRDPRFVDFLQRKGVTDLWRELGPSPDCRADGDTFVCGLESGLESGL